MRAATLALAVLLSFQPASAQEAPMRDAALQSRIDAALAAMPPGYVPRTRHIGPSGPVYTNRLILEASPYLRQHAHNPVDWRPWGEAALAEAAARDLPVFLSLGYATCHWCHVMEEESFDDETVGAVLNRDYIAIKVDREELPDIDAQYMYATLALTGRGGWPNNLVLTPSGEPFGAFSYTPKTQFLNVLDNVTTAWRDPARRPKVEEFGADVAAVVREEARRSAAARTLSEADFAMAADTLAGARDQFLGGWGEAQKFPNEVMIRFLLDQAQRTGSAAAGEAALQSLRAIAAGGIHDHAGGGFHRYTVDPEWRTPHFEKMLYNQALIAPLMVEGWRMSGDARLRRAAERALDYVLRDMTAPQGAFYSAEDADSLYHGGMEEGAFYVWTPDQLSAAAGADTDFAMNTLGLFKTATVPAGSVAHLEPDVMPDFARLDPVLDRLRQAREQRPHPLVDTKIITGWNGLMIRALAQGGAAMGTAHHIDAARRAADFLWASARRGEGLSRVWAEGSASGEGRLEDYAWLGLGLVALHDATGEAVWLDRAKALAVQIEPRFGAPDQSGLLRMAEKPGPLGARLDMEDGATPSSNASALELFALLAQRSDDPAHRARADALLAAMSGLLGERATAHPEGLTVAQIHLFGEAGAERSLAAGKLRIRARRAGEGLSLTLDFAPGWHANADRVRQDWLVPTELAGPGVADVRYPPARTVQLGFTDEPIDVIDGRVEISAARVGEMAELHIQVCSDETCLLPETTTFRPGAAW